MKFVSYSLDIQFLSKSYEQAQGCSILRMLRMHIVEQTVHNFLSSCVTTIISLLVRRLLDDERAGAGICA